MNLTNQNTHHWIGSKTMFSRNLNFRIFLLYLFLLWTLISCKLKEDNKLEDMPYQKGTFGYDLTFLKKYDQVILLQDSSGEAQVLVSPKFQGKVFTSTAQGLKGTSFGWINYDLIASGKIMEHMNVYGGEDRYWLGPEGGQYSIFFKPGVEMAFKNWHTPKEIDIESFDLVSSNKKMVSMKKEIHLSNYAHTEFDMRLTRDVRLLENNETEKLLNIGVDPDVKVVAFETKNSLMNTGQNPWNKQNGTLCIWILGMFRPSDKATVVIPYRQGGEERLGKIATTDYFGQIPEDRLRIEDGIIYFKADGNHRSKLGVAVKRAKQYAVSYDPLSGSLTIVNYSKPPGASEYINQLWKIQDDPFNGDVVNSYNDGPLEDGTQLGPFYELESSSPAAFLSPGESITHYHRTFHFVGTDDKLSMISEDVLGIDIEKIKTVF